MATWFTPSLALCDSGPYIPIRHGCTFETDLAGSCPLKGIYPTYTKTPLRNKHANGGNRGSQGLVSTPHKTVHNQTTRVNAVSLFQV